MSKLVDSFKMAATAFIVIVLSVVVVGAYLMTTLFLLLSSLWYLKTLGGLMLAFIGFLVMWTLIHMSLEEV